MPDKTIPRNLEAIEHETLTNILHFLMDQKDAVFLKISAISDLFFSGTGILHCKSFKET